MSKSYTMKTLVFITLFFATDLVFGVPPINFAIKYDAKEGEKCGGRKGPWCDDGLQCTGPDLALDGQGICKKLATQKEGDACGSCFSPDTNFDCGKCVEGLECIEDPGSALLPDLPSRCRKPSANLEICQDDQNWVDSKFGDGLGKCKDMTLDWCENQGNYSIEAKRACPKACKVCKVAIRLKQIGDSCGSSRSEICGLCDEGLECEGPFDACGQCVRKLIPTLYVLTCKGIECGLACKSPNFGEGVCDGEGFCVSAEENPCSEQGCGGKACGERCLSGDIVGTCSAQGDCEFNPDNVKCEKDTKQEGESCGDCFSPSTNFFCGVCAAGLECRESPDVDILPDAPPRCEKTKDNLEKETKQEGEDCGDCLSPSTNYFCGECAAGLECRKNPILPDAPGTCKKRTGEAQTKCFNPGNTIPSPHDSCNTCKCGKDGIIEGCTRRFCEPEPTIYLTSCAGQKCGLECVDNTNEGVGGFQGICDGEGYCVSPIENPCTVQGCDGKECGEICLEGDIAGLCDSKGVCQYSKRPDEIDCREEKLACAGKGCGASCIIDFDISGACNAEGICILNTQSTGCSNPCQNKPENRFCELPSGEFGRCNANEQCLPEAEEISFSEPVVDPYKKLLFCATNDPNYCEEKTDGQFHVCHKLFQPSCFIDGKTVKNCYGVCTPDGDTPEGYCDENTPCKSIGDTSTGKLTSRCTNEQCVFAPAIVIA